MSHLLCPVVALDRVFLFCAAHTILLVDHLRKGAAVDSLLLHDGGGLGLIASTSL